jgi:thioredoxin reductase (NADPH)
VFLSISTAINLLWISFTIQIETNEDRCIPVNAMMETSVGRFAAGDVTCTEVRQVVVAASQGCLAALAAEKYLYKITRYKIDWGK